MTLNLLIHMLPYDVWRTQKNPKDQTIRGSSVQPEICSEQIGITPSYLSKIERGVVPPPNEEILNDLADLLQISHDFLYVLAGRIREEQIHNFHNLLIAIDKDANDFQLLNIIQSIRLTRK